MPNETHYGMPLEKWEAAKEEARQVLIEHARQRKTISYSELTLAVHAAHIPYHGYMMAGFLREIHRADEEQGRPGLATLVVRKSDRLPGAGYFKELAQVGIPESDYRAYWESQFDEVCSYWEKQAGTEDDS